MLMGGLAPSEITTDKVMALLSIVLPKAKSFRLVSGLNIRFSRFIDLLDDLELDREIMTKALTDLLVTSYEYGLTPAPGTQLRYAQARANIIGMGERAVRFTDKFVRWVRSGGKAAQQLNAIAQEGLFDTMSAAASFTPGFSAGPGKTITAYTRTMRLRDAAWNKSEMSRLRALARAQRRAELLDLNQREDPSLLLKAPSAKDLDNSSLLIRTPRIRKRTLTAQQLAKLAEARQKRDASVLAKLRAIDFPEIYGSTELQQPPKSLEQLQQEDLLRRRGVYESRIAAIDELRRAADRAAAAANQAAAAAAATAAATVPAGTPLALRRQ